MYLYDDFIKACAHGDLCKAKILQLQGANIHAREDCALIWAAENGHLDVVKYLVEQHSEVWIPMLIDSGFQ